MTTPATHTLAALRLDAAAAAWTVLSAAFGRPPSEEFCTALRDPAQLERWPYDDAVSARGVRLLVRSAVAGESLPQLQADHRRLLSGPERLPAAPWESVHRSRDGLVFERETMQVRAFYGRFDVQAPRLNVEPDDHVSLECAFLAHLCARALDAVDRGEDPRRFTEGYQQFVDEHASRWMPQFFEEVGAHAATEFYRGLTALGAGTVRHATEAVLNVPERR